MKQENILKKLLTVIVFPLFFITFQGCGPSKPHDVVKKYLEAKTMEERYNYMIEKTDFDGLVIRNHYGEIKYQSISSSPRNFIKGEIIVDVVAIVDGETVPTSYILKKDNDGQYKVDVYETITFRNVREALQM